MSLRTRLRALLAVSTYDLPPPEGSLSLDDPDVEARRKLYGGQLAGRPVTQIRWYQADLERALQQADAGLLQIAARLWASCKRDGTFMGVLSTRTGGLVRLPKKFRGRADIVAALQLGTSGGPQGPRSVFDEMFPQAELAALAADGIGLGVGVAELVPVQGRDFPVMRRRDPEFLVYRHNENRWYYQTIVGMIPITPGDGRWILHVPGAAYQPWKNGMWMAIGTAYIAKAHALQYDMNWQAKLANPARVAYWPQGSGEDQKQGFFRQLMAWGSNSVFGLPPGYEIKLLESNGKGSDSFERAIVRAEREMVIAIAGQTVTTDGGTGFANADIHKSIRSDLIKETADSLAYTINTQGIPVFVIKRFGEEALDESALVEWNVTPAKDLKSAADALQRIGTAIQTLTTALAPFGKQVNIEELCQRFDVPIAGDLNGDGESEADQEISFDIDFDFEASNDTESAAA